MPTGYTANLEKDYNVKRWLKESVVRAFGVCMNLRDEGDMSQEGILKSLKKTMAGDNYHAKALKKAQAELKEANQRTDADWIEILATRKKEEQDDYTKSLSEYAIKKAAHVKAIGQVASLYNKAVADKEEELIVNSMKFALDQLNQTLDFDYGREPSKPSILTQTTLEYKASVIKSLEWNVKYHTENAEKEKMNDGRADMYQRFINFVDKNLKDGV